MGDTLSRRDLRLTLHADAEDARQATSSDSEIKAFKVARKALNFTGIVTTAWWRLRSACCAMLF